MSRCVFASVLALTSIALDSGALATAGMRPDSTAQFNALSMPAAAPAQATNIDDGAGGIIVVSQTLVFLAAFLFAPKHGLLAARRRARRALTGASA